VAAVPRTSFDADNTSLGDFRLVPTVGWTLLSDQLKVSADGLRIVALTESIGIRQGILLTSAL